MGQTDIDKKIAGWEKLRYAGSVMEVQEALGDAIVQLKECREETDRLRRESSGKFTSQETENLVIQTEQRIKKACFEAGWGWILDLNNFSKIIWSIHLAKHQFEQAIDSVGKKP